MTLYEAIKSLCDEKGWSICDLERAADVGNGIVGKWRTANPRVDRLDAVANALGITTADLLSMVDKGET